MRTRTVVVLLLALVLAACTPSEPTDADIAQEPVRGDRVENFYFVMTDRFANGHPGNDSGGADGGRQDHGFDPTDPGFFHGGDLAGLRQQLDYVEGLGVTAIWLTPVFTNQPVQGSGDDASAGYHGYWTTDFTRVDPHLGSNAELELLVEEADARGINVYLDVITNHTADGITYAEGSTKYVNTAVEKYRDSAGEEIDVYALAGTKSWPELDAETSFPYTPVRREGITKTPDWLNDVTLYHNRGDSTWTGESVTMGDFVGLDDLMTEHPRVVEGMVDIYTSWVDLGIAGFRIDTVKHVNLEFWEEWTAAISHHADDVNPDFFMFGEVYEFDPALTAPYVRGTHMDATLDFAFQQAAVAFAGGDTARRLSELFAADPLYLSATTSAAMAPTFLGNHDMGRVGHFLQGKDDAPRRSLLAHELLFLSRGQPVVYYGDEQGLAGTGGDKAARQSMFATQVPEWVDEPLLGGQPRGDGDLFDTGAPLYRAISELAALRESNPALAAGAQYELHSDDGAGIYAFSRVDRTELVEHLVALNNSADPATVSLTTLTPGATYTGIHGTNATVTADADGIVELTVEPLQAVVLVADAEVAPGDGRLALDLPDAFDGEVWLAAEVTPGRWAETTFAVREADGPWETLGVAEGDDPRILVDLSTHEPGTELELRAVTRDAAGTLVGESATITVVG